MHWRSRGDGNTIKIGDGYELYFWNDGDWQSFGKKVAECMSLVHDNDLRGTLLLLRDLTKGKDEKIFMLWTSKMVVTINAI